MVAKFVALWLALACTTGLLADEPGDTGSTIPLSKLFRGYSDYLELSTHEIPALVPVYTLTSETAPAEALELGFEYEGEVINFAPEQDGKLRYRPTAAMLAADPMVHSNQPKGSLALSLTLDVVLVGKTRYDIGDLHKQVHVAWGQAKDFGGLMAVFSPKHVSLIVHFPDSCTDKRWSVTKGKELVVEGAGQAGFELDFGDKKVRKADLLVLSCRPERFSLK